MAPIVTPAGAPNHCCCTDDPGFLGFKTVDSDLGMAPMLAVKARGGAHGVQAGSVHSRLTEIGSVSSFLCSTLG